MRVAIVAPLPVPAVVGGAERLYDGLLTAFEERTEHEAELIKLPSPEHSFAQLVDSYDAFARLDLSPFDLVISTKYPSWMIRHPNHVVYMLHPLRGLYDSYHLFGMPTEVRSAPPEADALVHLLDATPHGTERGARRILDTARWVVDRLGDDHPVCGFPGPLVRRLVRWLDRDALDVAHTRAHFAISRRVTERDDYFPPGVVARSLPPPTALTGLHPGPFRSFFTASRLDGPKRIDLLIDAMAHVRSDVQLRIAGTGPDEERLKGRARDDGRVVFLGRVDEAQLVDEYAQALAVPFVPLDEDFGLVTVEAQLAGKPVVTCADSGGVTELVEHEVSGFVVDADPEAIARALDALAASPRRAEEMGDRGEEAARRITWGAVLDALTCPPPPPAPAPAGAVHPPERSTRARRRKLVVLSTYPAAPARGGGQVRLNRLLRGLAARFDVQLVALDDAGGEPGITELANGALQIVIARSNEHLGFEGGLGARSSIPTSDIAASLFVDRTRDYIDALRSAASDADGVVLEQPFLLPALLRAAPHLPFVYDSQNAEFEMKDLLLGADEHGAAFVDVVRTVERRAVRGAELIATCSTDDQRRLRRLGPTLASWTLAPNGADVFATDFVAGGSRTRRRDEFLAALARSSGRQHQRVALFVASYHPPNLEAAETIISIAPSLPHVAFVLAGSHGNAFVSWELPPNVVMAGVVAPRALQTLLSAADVALNPIRSGGGTNLKLIEYFAAGAPVVSSPLGARGVAVVDGTHLLLAEDDQLVPAIAATLADPSQAERRARNARALAEAGYDWSTIAERFADDVERALLGADW